MPKLPRNLSQARAIRHLFEPEELRFQSEAAVLMPNGHLIILPMTLKVGLLSSQIKEADMTIEQFIEKL